MTPRRSPPKTRRAELIAIAYNHIAQRGFEGLRVRDVAAQAGINNATLHYYFPTKEDLIKGVVDTMILNYSLSFDTASAVQEAPDAWQEIRAELEDARRNFRDTRDQLVVFTELLIRSLRDPLIAPIFAQLDQSWRGFLEEIIARGVRQAVFRPAIDPPVAATLLMAQIKGFGFQMLGETRLDLADAVFDQLILQVQSWLCGPPLEPSRSE